MAELYKMLPLSFEHDVLTVAMSDPTNMQALDDLRNMLGIKHRPGHARPGRARSTPPSPRSTPASKEETISDLIASLEADERRRQATSAKRPSTSTT